MFTKDATSIPESLSRSELVDAHDYPDKDKSVKENYFLYTINTEAPSVLSLDEEKCQEYISGVFSEERKEDRSPVFKTVRELMNEMNR